MEVNYKLIVIIIGVFLGVGLYVVKVLVKIGEWYVVMVC